MTKRHKRLLLVIFLVLGVSAATALALTALQKNTAYFFSPSEVMAGKAPSNKLFRVGGLVVVGSVKRSEQDLTVHFGVTDQAQQLTVRYVGSLPALFREGKGIVAKGKLQADGVFVAEELLAKHDENYMPPEVAASLKAQHEQGKAGLAP